MIAGLGDLVNANFQGQTTTGQHIQTQGGLDEYIDTGKELCFILRNVEVGQGAPEGHMHKLCLTNIRFPTDNPGAIAFTVSWGATMILVRLCPLRNYQERIRELMKSRGIIPTTVLQFHAADLAGNALSQFIMDLCHGLSLVQGRKINWIHHATYGPRRAFQRAVFGETITKASPAQPLCFIPTAPAAVTLSLTAAKDAISAIKQFRETFDPHNRLINAWLDARTQTDYLEGRTLKYVVVIEALIALTTRADKNMATTVRDPKAWAQLYEKNIIPALPAGAANWLTLGNWQRLNVRSFRNVLEASCKVHRITVPPEDVTCFSRIRNAIVHRFDYDYNNRLPREWKMPNHPEAAQHYFAAGFVDRIILQLFGLGTQLQSSVK